MVDFHSHILPEMDDGADSVDTSLAMLRESFRQGVDLICATPHFYADEEDPKSFLLVEPPMLPWSEAMLDEIEACVSSLRCIPVIAHIDRYMRLLNAPELLNRVAGRKMLIQANAAFFLHRQSQDAALDSLRHGRIHFLGSDCHDLTGRPPNLGAALDVIRNAGAEKDFERFNTRVTQAIKQVSFS